MIPKAIYMDLKKIALLLVFFIFYVIIGGFVFMALEAPLEQDKRNEIETVLAEFREKLLNHPNITQEHITHMIHTLLVAQDMNLVDNYGNDTDTNWNFFNSFFFAITVITTIGYGHLSPSTTMGRIFCLLYALFGIPMTGILLGAIGDRFSRCFLDQVSEIRGRYQRQFSVRLLMLKQGLLFFVPWFIVFLVLPATLFIFIEDWSFLQGFYYCFITLSTIGFGDYVAGNFQVHWTWLYKIILVLWIVFGLAYLSMILNFISQGLRSSHLTSVVHSIRRMSGPPFAGGKSLTNSEKPMKCNLCKSQRCSRLALSRRYVNCHNKYIYNRSPQVCIDNTDKKSTNVQKFMSCFKFNNKKEKQPHKPKTFEIHIPSPNLRRTSSLPDLNENLQFCLHPVDSEDFYKNSNQTFSKENGALTSREELLEKRRQFFNV